MQLSTFGRAKEKYWYCQELAQPLPILAHLWIRRQKCVCNSRDFDDKSAYATRKILTTKERKSYFGEIGGEISLFRGILVTCSQYQIHKKILAGSEPPLLGNASIFRPSVTATLPLGTIIWSKRTNQIRASPKKKV